MGALAVTELRWAPLAATAACLFALAALIAYTPGAPLPGQSGSEARLQASIARAPLSFEPNAGRTDDRVDFLARSVAGGSLYLTSREAVLVLPQGKHDSRALRLAFPGADPEASARGLAELPGKANSFIGDDSSKWRSGIPTYGRVRYHDLYPGVDLDFYGDQRDLEYDFRLAPHADSSQIAVKLSGADSLRVAANRDLLIEVGDTTVRQRAPVAYQQVAGERRRVSAAYELRDSTVGFRLGAYDHSRPLVIDPLVLGYSTYLGGGSEDFGYAIAVDGDGAAYVTGRTDSANFPIQDQLFPDQALQDAFVTKLNPDSGGAVTLAYSTYLGASGDERAFGIAVDSAGAAYVSGNTDSPNFPTQDAFQTHQGGTDAFVTKLNPDSGGAVTLAYSTYLGGAANDFGRRVAVDEKGAAYVTGDTGSTDFPAPDGFQTDQALQDAFVTKLNPDSGGAVTLAYSTYLGGGDIDGGVDIAVDSAGAAYVTGNTRSTDFPTQDLFQADPGDAGYDAFVTKLNPDSGGAVTLAYSTYLGSDSFDVGLGIAVDSAGASYVTGTTYSNFPFQDQLFPDQALQDAFVTKLNPDSGGAVTLAYSTYLGASGNEAANGIAVDSAGAAYVTGNTDSPDFPTQDEFQTDQGGTDAFVTKLNPDSGGAVTIAYSTYLGGGGFDIGSGIAVDGKGGAYVSGNTDSTDFLTQDQFQTDPGDSNTDAFAAKLTIPAPPPPPPPPEPPSNKFSFGKVKKHRSDGTATLFVNVPGTGTLVLTGKGLVRQRQAGSSRAARVAAKTVSAAGKVKLLVKAKGRKKRRLNRTGKVRVRARVTFTPTGGEPLTKAKRIRLIKLI